MFECRLWYRYHHILPVNVTNAKRFGRTNPKWHRQVAGSPSSSQPHSFHSFPYKVFQFATVPATASQLPMARTDGTRATRDGGSESSLIGTRVVVAQSDNNFKTQVYTTASVNVKALGYMFSAAQCKSRWTRVRARISFLLCSVF